MYEYSYRNDKIITVNYNKQRRIIYKYRVHQNVWFGTPILSKIICTTSGHIAFWYISNRHIIKYITTFSSLL